MCRGVWFSSVNHENAYLVLDLSAVFSIVDFELPLVKSCIFVTLISLEEIQRRPLIDGKVQT